MERYGKTVILHLLNAFSVLGHEENVAMLYLETIRLKTIGKVARLQLEQTWAKIAKMPMAKQQCSHAWCSKARPSNQLQHLQVLTYELKPLRCKTDLLVDELGPLLRWT